jgi:hypothetical protein
MLPLPMLAVHHLARAVRLLWASPTSLLGLVAALPVLLAGGSVRRVDHTLEVALRSHVLPRASRGRRSHFAAITLGHVILGRTHAELARLRAHERVHVRQAERLGPFFVPAYLLASAIAWWRGACPYRGNHFEVEAYAVDLTAGRRALDTTPSSPA